MPDMFGEEVSQEEVDFLISNILDLTLEEYGLKHEPVDGSLEACLDAYTKVKLIKLADENGIEVKQSWKKSQIIEFLSAGIMESIEERFLILQQSGLTLLQFMADGKFVSKEYAYEKVEFFLTVYQVAVRLGLLYITEKNDEVVMTMPGKIKRKLDEALDYFDALQVEYQSELKLWDQMNEVLVAGIHLYGVMTTFNFSDLWETRYPDFNLINIEEMRKFYSCRNKYLPLLIIGNGYIFTDQYIIGSPEFVDAETVIEFYNYRTEKMGSIYYEPTKQEIEYYAKHLFNQESLVYNRLKQEVEKLTTDVEMFMRLIETTILSGEEITNLLINSAEIGLIEFESEEQFINFTDIYINLHNTSRLWENAGFTASEMVNQVTDKYNFPDDFSWADEDDEEFESDNIISLNAFRRDKDED